MVILVVVAVVVVSGIDVVMTCGCRRVNGGVLEKSFRFKTLRVVFGISFKLVVVRAGVAVVV